MSDEFVIQLIREAFYYVLVVAGPLLLLALIVGLIISIFQAATSINEQTLSFVPKLVLVFIVTVLVMPFMLSNLKTYAIGIFNLIPTLK
ncbi:MAG: flagellar biosynthesis protein FliQ [Candidatus Kapaibacterium sp.]|jgi:flagellar biosynthetic protein FliQ|nr:flagellar biosynthesis protein FliQ [Ignavibacteria bacterium]MBN8573115.1 flagellar biosynthesis protein FliQ [Candidatus Kapabacteria bacterium]HRK59918.1 flagellar biosynthesis protein FliQ [Candidatus Kapabacteria bacterium]